MDDIQRLSDCPGNPQAIQKRTYQKKTIVYESKYVARDFILIVLPIGIAYWLLFFRWAKGPGPDRLGFWLGGAKGPGPERLGFGLGGQGSWAGPAWLGLGGPRFLGRTLGVCGSVRNKHFLWSLETGGEREGPRC